LFSLKNEEAIFFIYLMNVRRYNDQMLPCRNHEKSIFSKSLSPEKIDPVVGFLAFPFVHSIGMILKTITW
jgi:hypothetical protein